jgi:hypothetical protein
MSAHADQAVPQDERHWTQTLRGLGPLTYLPKGRTTQEPMGDLGSVTAIDSAKAVLAVGARVGRGLAAFAGIAVVAAAVVFALVVIGDADGMAPRSEARGWFLTGLLALFGVLFLSADLNRVAETLVLLNRKTRQIVAADPTAKVKRVKDIQYLTWNWDECDFAIERVVLTAAAGQTFHLRAVQRDAQGKPERTILLAAMIPTIQSAEAIYEFLRRYMAQEDAGLPKTVKLVPAGRLNFFEACKHSFITYLVQVGDDGLPRWPLPLVLLFYAGLAAGLVVAFPFVLGKVLAEWSSQEMQFPAGTVPEDGQPIPAIDVIPARQAVFAPWEKAYYLACMAGGLLFWVWLVRYVMRVFGG